MVVPEDVVWAHPNRYSDPVPWTEEMLRSWVKSLSSVEELDVVWRVCAEPGAPGVRGQVIAEHLAPHLSGRPALTALSVVSRRMNKAARELWARRMPFVIDEVTRTRTVDPAVAAILLDALAAHPSWPRMRHHQPARSSRPPVLRSCVTSLCAGHGSLATPMQK